MSERCHGEKDKLTSCHDCVTLFEFLHAPAHIPELWIELESLLRLEHLLKATCRSAAIWVSWNPVACVLRLGADCLKLLRYPTKNFKESWTTTCIRNNFGVMIDFFLSCLARWPSSCQLHLERCSQSHSKRRPASQVVCACNSRPKLQAKPWCLGKTHI